MFPVIKSVTPASTVTKVRLCRDCKYFQKGTKEYPVHFCQKIFFVSLITGCEEPTPAIVARSDIALCGQVAQYFESKE